MAQERRPLSASPGFIRACDVVSVMEACSLQGDLSMLSGLTTKLIIAGVVLAVLGGVGLYLKGIIDENAVLQANQKQLETALDLKDTEIASLQDQAASTRERAQVANQKLWAAEKSVSDLEQLLSKHDLTLLTKHRPDTMTRLIQKGTADQLHNTEDAANAQLQ